MSASNIPFLVRIFALSLIFTVAGVFLSRVNAEEANQPNILIL